MTLLSRVYAIDASQLAQLFAIFGGDTFGDHFGRLRKLALSTQNNLADQIESSGRHLAAYFQDYADPCFVKKDHGNIMYKNIIRLCTLISIRLNAVRLQVVCLPFPQLRKQDLAARELANFVVYHCPNSCVSTDDIFSKSGLQFESGRCWALVE